MKSSNSNRLPKSHFFGVKLRRRRQDFGLTLEDLMNRCVAIDPVGAPSVSYLSLLETGRRAPTEKLLSILGQVFNESLSWFLDDSTGIDTDSTSSRSSDSFVLEPRALFDKSILSRALPEVLTQTGISGRRFAYVLIGALCERQKNHFPDIEREAEALGGKKFPVDINDVLELCGRVGLKIEWFDHAPVTVAVGGAGQGMKSLVRSFFHSPGVIYVNRRLEAEVDRLKFEIALRLGHMVLHGGDGVISDHATGGELGAAPHGEPPPGFVQHQKDVLIAWRDFECSYFASALLLSRRAFRRFVIRTRYDVQSATKLGYTPSLVMRRMTSVSPYPHWHYFDLYPPSFVRFYYRGNNIPLPYHQENINPDSICRRWGMFRVALGAKMKRSVQLSLMKHDGRRSLYACLSVPATDAAQNGHVLTMGVDLGPAIESTDKSLSSLLGQVEESVTVCPGSALSAVVQKEFHAAVGLLNIGFVHEAIESPPEIVCTWARFCPRATKCSEAPSGVSSKSPIEELRKAVIYGRPS